MFEEIYPGHKDYPLLESNIDILKSIEVYGFWKLDWLTVEFKEEYLKVIKRRKKSPSWKYLEAKRKKTSMADGIEVKLRKIFGASGNRVFIIQIPDMIAEELELQEKDTMSIWHVDDTIMIKKSALAKELIEKKDEQDKETKDISVRSTGDGFVFISKETVEQVAQIKKNNKQEGNKKL